jgi:hypothetical protein
MWTARVFPCGGSDFYPDPRLSGLIRGEIFFMIFAISGERDDHPIPHPPGLFHPVLQTKHLFHSTQG